MLKRQVSTCHVRKAGNCLVGVGMGLVTLGNRAVRFGGEFGHDTSGKRSCQVVVGELGHDTLEKQSCQVAVVEFGHDTSGKQGCQFAVGGVRT